MEFSIHKMVIDIKEELLNYNNYLLLQGPKGFFFYKLAKFLMRSGKNVFKINFNGGDLITFPLFKNAYNYRKKIEHFEEYLKNFIMSKKIDVVILYGDYRPYHRIAIKLCKNIAIPVYVFEEGYIRPHYITLERSGVNGWSNLPKDPDFYRNLPEITIPEPLPSGFSYTKRIISCFIYYLFVELLRWYFPYYRPSKKYFPYLHIIFCYLLRSSWRKFIYKVTERKVFKLLNGRLKNRYFLVPLQVHNDTQITIHSKYNSIEDFIYEVIESFAKHANNLYLVFKHHPEDRGFKNYEKCIKQFAEKFNVKERVFYVHDLHLPTLIKGSLGVIVINSTVGLQALYHNRPVKVMGKAIYDIEGLTFQGPLDKFWQNPVRPDRKLFTKFRNYVIKRTQLNGSFYGRFPFESMTFSSTNLKTFSMDSSKVNK